MSRALLVLLSAAIPVFSLAAQDPSSEITFDTIPENVSVNGGGEPIKLEGDAVLSGSILVSGLIETDAGIRFPDATVQVTAAPQSKATANQGLYSNIIVAFSPPHAYSEICFKSGGFQFDVHTIGEPTEGGNCLPGDRGFIVERTEREEGAVATWAQARSTCLVHEMRLLEPFEWQFACDNAGLLELDNMAEEQWEWASNTVTPIVFEMTVPVFGNGQSCAALSRGRTATTNDLQDIFEVRCGR